MGVERLEDRTYEVGVDINDGYFVAEITPPLQKESNLDEMARIAFMGSELILSRTVTSYHPISTIFVGFYEQNKAQASDIESYEKKAISRGVVNLLSPVHSADIFIEYVD